MNLIAFAASTSTTSINKKLVTYAASLIKSADVEILDLNGYDLPLFSEDKERELGQPDPARQFLDKVSFCDGLLISFAEHNGSYSAAYKNIFDWVSRINPKVYQGKPMILLSTSPGPGGAANVLASALSSMPHFGGIVIGSFSLPSFYENFDMGNKQVRDKQLQTQLQATVEKIMD